MDLNTMCKKSLEDMHKEFVEGHAKAQKEWNDAYNSSTEAFEKCLNLFSKLQEKDEQTAATFSALAQYIICETRVIRAENYKDQIFKRMTDAIFSNCLEEVKTLKEKVAERDKE